MHIINAVATHHFLDDLGFDRVVEVRAGKSFEIVVEKGRRGNKTIEAELRRMCEELLKGLPQRCNLKVVTSEIMQSQAYQVSSTRL